jgi:hemerythrin
MVIWVRDAPEVSYVQVNKAEMSKEPSPSSASQESPSSLLIGVPAIDAEHRELISTLKALRTNPNASPGSEAFSEILDQLGRQIMTHFQNEERFFKQSSFGMPADEIRRHEQAHQAIVEQYAVLCINLMQRKAMGRSEALEMVEHWVVGHVVHHDLRLRDYLTGQPPDRADHSTR